MEKYIVRLLPPAYHDIDALYRYIADELFAPVTADKYVDGIYDTIAGLVWVGGSLAVSQNEYIQKHYGPDARTIRYKKITIIYNVVKDIVLVRRVMASSLIQ